MNKLLFLLLALVPLLLVLPINVIVNAQLPFLPKSHTQSTLNQIQTTNSTRPTNTNTTMLDKNFQSCYKIVTQAMIQANPSNPMLKYAFAPVPIPSFKTEVIQNLTQPVHLKMLGQENLAGESLVKQVADCMRLLK